MENQGAEPLSRRYLVLTKTGYMTIVPFACVCCKTLAAGSYDAVTAAKRLMEGK